jgi:hypothetical protein
MTRHGGSYKDVNLIAKTLCLNVNTLIDFLETCSDEVLKKYKETANILRQNGRDEDED